jgi:ABC-type transport system involved in multi-copper enzyme maturation permease subunit
VFSAVVRSELAKIRSLRSTVVTLALVLLISVGLGVVSFTSVRIALDRGSPVVRPDFEPVTDGLVTVLYGQLALVAFGVLAICGEYGSGMVRASLTATPDRRTFYLGKITACAAVALVLSYVTVLATFLTAHWTLGKYGPSFSSDGAVRAVLGLPLYLTALCLFALGVGTMLRHTALALTVMLSFVFALSPLAAAVPGIREFGRYLPDQAGMSIMKVGQQADPVVGPWTGLLVLLAWTVAALLGGFLVLRRRDA